MIAVVAGARPNFVKVAPILREMDRRGIASQYVHTVQHWGEMDLGEELGLRAPDLALSNTRPGDLDSIAMALTRAWAKEAPRAVVVVGDVTSTLAAALAATAHGIHVVHVEAGLRSGDWEMPEERNRAIVDELSDLLLTTEQKAVDNLCALGLPRHRSGRIVPVGNVMIDSLRWAEAKIETRSAPWDQAPASTQWIECECGWRYMAHGHCENAAHAGNVAKKRAERQPETMDYMSGQKTPYALVTVHRPSNVDTFEAWEQTCRAIGAIKQHLPVILVAHPRTKHWLKGYGGPLPDWTLCLDPQSYVQMVRLMKGSRFVATDSGGVQEETTALGIPCLTLRENTERPITVTEGTNTIVGLEPALICSEVRKILGGAGKRGKIPEGWDGHAAERIVDAIQERYL